MMEGGGGGGGVNVKLFFCFFFFLLFVGWLLNVPSNMLVYNRDRSA